MNYLNMQRIGHRKEKLKEICIMMWEEGQAGLGNYLESPFFFVLDLCSGGACVVPSVHRYNSTILEFETIYTSPV